MTFGTDVKVEFNLGDANVDTMDKAIKAIDEIIYTGGGYSVGTCVTRGQRCRGAASSSRQSPRVDVHHRRNV